MTMFERDFIERVESVIGSKPFSTTHTIADAIINEFIRLNKRVQELEQEHCEKYYPEALDHIEHLQARVQELEIQLKSSACKLFENSEEDNNETSNL